MQIEARDWQVVRWLGMRTDMISLNHYTLLKMLLLLPLMISHLLEIN